MNFHNIKSILLLLLFVGSSFAVLAPLHPVNVHATTAGTTLNVGLNRFATIPSLNPYSPVYVNPLDSEMYLRCVQVDYAPASHDTGKLCNSWSSNSNYTTWNLNLMSGLKWSDGSPLNATDLAWSLLYGNATGYFTPYLSSVKTDNATGVTVTVPISQPNWLDNMENIFIVPYENWKSTPISAIANYTAFTNIVGAGPYILPSYTAGTNPLIMMPNQYYYGGNNQYYSQVDVHIFSSLSSMESAMLAGQIDIMWYAGTGQSTSAFNSSSVKVFEFTATDQYQILNLNYLKAPLNNVSFREGLAYATDRNALSQTVYGPGYALINYGGGPTVASGENTYPYNTTAAQQMFTKAGLTMSGGKLDFSNGSQVTINLQIPTGEPDSQNIATLVAQQWAKVGINVQTQVTDATTLYADFGTGNWQAASLTEDGTTGTPIRYTDQLQSSGLTIVTAGGTPGKAATPAQYITPQVGELIGNQSVVPTGSAQYNALTAQLTPIIAQLVPMIPLYTDADIVVYNSNINFGSNSTNPNDATGIYDYQTNVQQPYNDGSFYYAHPLSAASSTASAGSSTTSSAPTTSSSSSSTSSKLTGSFFEALAVAVLVIAIVGMLAYSRKKRETKQSST